MPIVLVRDAGAPDAQFLEAHRDASRSEANKYRGNPELLEPVEGPVSSLVAEIQGEVVGSCSWYVKNDDAVIMHIYVDPDAREVGVGDSLMREFLGRAARSASHVRGRALPGDREMKNLFERHGLTAQVIVVGRRLGD